MQTIHDCTLRLSTLKTSPPNVTNTNCIRKIAPMTKRKFLFRPRLSNTIMWLVLALNQFNVIAIINVANNADFKYVTSTLPNRFLTGDINRIAKQINVM